MKPESTSDKTGMWSRLKEKVFGGKAGKSTSATMTSAASSPVLGEPADPPPGDEGSPS